MTTSLEVSQGHEDVVGPSTKGKTTVHIGPVDVDRIRMHLLAVASRLRNRITLETLRPLPLFLGVTGPAFCFSAGAFTPPSRHLDKTAPEKIRARVALNFAFFVTNYALLTLGTAVVVALMHPGMLLWLSVIYGLWALHFFIMRNEVEIFVLGRDVVAILKPERRSLALTVLTVVGAIWKCLVPLLSVVAISGVIILFHAVMRDPKNIESSSAFYGSEDSDDECEGEGDSEEVLVERGDVI